MLLPSADAVARCPEEDDLWWPEGDLSGRGGKGGEPDGRKRSPAVRNGASATRAGHGLHPLPQCGVVGGEGFAQWLDDLVEHADERRVVAGEHRTCGCDVVLLLADQPPVELPPGIACHQIPEEPLRASVAFAERVQHVEIVVVDAHPLHELSAMQAAQIAVIGERALAVRDARDEHVGRQERCVRLADGDGAQFARPVVDVLEQVVMNLLQLSHGAARRHPHCLQLERPGREQRVFDRGQRLRVLRADEIAQHLRAGDEIRVDGCLVRADRLMFRFGVAMDITGDGALGQPILVDLAVGVCDECVCETAVDMSAFQSDRLQREIDIPLADVVRHDIVRSVVRRCAHAAMFSYANMAVND